MRIPVFCGGQLRQVKDVVAVATSYQSWVLTRQFGVKTLSVDLTHPKTSL
jgi:hypothetical protein